jgi:hypothetical protein
MNKKVNKAWNKIAAALSSKAPMNLGELQLSSLKTRLIIGVLIAAAYLACVLIIMPDPGSGFTNDTADYLQLSPYRQPMYGMWANAVHAFSNSWRTVQVLQVAGYILGSAWVIVELAIISGLGILFRVALFWYAIGIYPVGAT